MQKTTLIYSIDCRFRKWPRLIRGPASNLMNNLSSRIMNHYARPLIQTKNVISGRINNLVWGCSQISDLTIIRNSEVAAFQREVCAVMIKLAIHAKRSLRT